MGARNARQRALVKLFYVCERSPPAAPGSPVAVSAAADAATPERLLLSLTPTALEP